MTSNLSLLERGSSVGGKGPKCKAGQKSFGGVSCQSLIRPRVECDAVYWEGKPIIDWKSVRAGDTPVSY